MAINYLLQRQYLMYDFTYEEQRHRGCIILDEDTTPNLTMIYDDHDLEVTWIKRIRHKGAKIELNIVLDDDVEGDPNKVVASAWVCVYKDGNLIISFEPDCWSYMDKEDESHNTCKGIFYEDNVGHGCRLCANPAKCRKKYRSKKVSSTDNLNS